MQLALPIAHIVTDARDSLRWDTKLGGRPFPSFASFEPQLHSESTDRSATTLHSRQVQRRVATIPPSLRQRVAADATCCVCKGPLFLIAQLSCPIDRDDDDDDGEVDGGHRRGTGGNGTTTTLRVVRRMMYLFGCNASRCASQGSGSWKAFTLAVVMVGDASNKRTAAAPGDADGQMGEGTAAAVRDHGDGGCDRTAAAAGADEEALLPDDDEDDIDDDEYFEGTVPFGTAQPLAGEAPSSSSPSAVLPPTQGQPVLRCPEANALARKSRYTFPSIALDVVDEPLAATCDGALSDMNEEKMREINARSEGITESDLEELDRNFDLKNKSTDIAYEKFRSILSRCPTQVLRYQRHGIPIFMNPDKTIHVVIPPCEMCGGPRAMELQLMPTAIFFLQVASFVDVDVVAARKPATDDGLDFATVTVYTCLRGCQFRHRGARELMQPHHDRQLGVAATGDGRPPVPSHLGTTWWSDDGGHDGHQREEGGTARVVMRMMWRSEFLFVEGPPTMEDDDRSLPSVAGAMAGAPLGR